MARHRWLTSMIRDFELNPAVQIRFHLVAMMFWMANAVAGTIVLVAFPRVWLAVGVYYVFMLSVYANFDTDYDAVSAAQSSLKAGKLLARMEAQDRAREAGAGNGPGGEAAS